MKKHHFLISSALIIISAFLGLGVSQNHFVTANAGVVEGPNLVQYGTFESYSVGTQLNGTILNGEFGSADGGTAYVRGDSSNKYVRIGTSTGDPVFKSFFWLTPTLTNGTEYRIKFDYKYTNSSSTDHAYGFTFLDSDTTTYCPIHNSGDATRKTQSVAFPNSDVFTYSYDDLSSGWTTVTIDFTYKSAYSAYFNSVRFETYLAGANDYLDIDNIYCGVLTTTIDPTSISINGGDFSVQVGEERNLTYSYLPGTATPPTVTWSSSNPSVATVNSSTGAFVAVAAGTTTITINDTEHSLVDSISVEVTEEEPTWYEGSNLIINGDFEAFSIGTTFSATQLEGAWGSYVDGSYKDNPGHIVDGGGDHGHVVVFGKLDGDTGNTGYGSIFVMTPDTLQIGMKIRFSYDYKFSLSADVTSYDTNLNSSFVGSSNKEYYRIQHNQGSSMVATTGPETTHANITVKNLEDGWKNVSIDFTITNDIIQWNSIRWLIKTSTLGDQYLVDNVKLRKISNVPFNYPTKITITSEDLLDGNIDMDGGDEVELGFTYRPLDAEEPMTMIWTSSDENVATVESDGGNGAVVTAHHEGACKITLTIENNVKNSIDITVWSDESEPTPSPSPEPTPTSESTVPPESESSETTSEHDSSGTSQSESTSDSTTPPVNPDNPDKPNNNNVLVIVGIVGGSVIVIGGFALTFALKARKTRLMKFNKILEKYRDYDDINKK